MVEGHWRKYSEIGSLAKDEMPFEYFLFVAPAATLFNGMEPCQQSSNFDQKSF